MKKNIICLIVLVTISIATNVFAQSVDSLSWPGANCHNVGSSQAVVSDLGFIYTNVSTGSATVVCPIAFDPVLANELFVNISVRDSSTSAPITCTLYSKDTSTDLIDSISISTSTSGTGSGDLGFYDNSPGGPINGLDVDGAEYVYIACELPASAATSRIYRYKWIVK
jgi:hypothetical protein